jgi:hypothetical protein
MENIKLSTKMNTHIQHHANLISVYLISTILDSEGEYKRLYRTVASISTVQMIQ